MDNPIDMTKSHLNYKPCKGTVNNYLNQFKIIFSKFVLHSRKNIKYFNIFVKNYRSSQFNFLICHLLFFILMKKHYIFV